jgi:UDP-N-acetylglucosamine transferase subunit ALG13
MIFVTVGTHYFEELVVEVDRLVESGAISDPVVAQIGRGKYLPKHCEYFRIAHSLAPYYERAGLVIGHGGTGTTLESLALGIPTVSVANPMLADNHQHEFLCAMEARTGLVYCQDLNQLAASIEMARHRPRIPFSESSLRFQLVRDLTQFVEQASRKHFP